MDNDLPSWDAKTSVVATDNFAGGKLAGEYLKAHLKPGATVGQIAGVPACRRSTTASRAWPKV